MLHLNLNPCLVLFVGKSSFDHGILDQLSAYCQPDPHWVEGVPQALAVLGEQSWGLCIIHLDPDPRAALATSSILAKSYATSGRPAQPCIGITASRDTSLEPLRSASGLDAIVNVPCEPQTWASLFSDPVSFDPEALIDRMMGNEILAKRVVGVFLEDAPRQLMALQDALVRQDDESGSRIAHSLRGAASNAGGDALVSLARTIEYASSSGNFDEVERTLPKLEEKFARLRPILERFCR